MKTVNGDLFTCMYKYWETDGSTPAMTSSFNNGQQLNESGKDVEEAVM